MPLDEIAVDNFAPDDKVDATHTLYDGRKVGRNKWERKGIRMAQPTTDYQTPHFFVHNELRTAG